MENIVLSVHLIIALCLIGVVLLQRSENSGGLMGGGGNTSARSAANALTKLTWMLAIGFLVTSLALTVIASQKASENSVLDRIDLQAPISQGEDNLVPQLDLGDLTPPTATNEPTTPPAADAPAAPPASE